MLQLTNDDTNGNKSVSVSSMGMGMKHKTCHHTVTAPHHTITAPHHTVTAPHHTVTAPHHTVTAPHHTVTAPHHTVTAPHHTVTAPHHTITARLCFSYGRKCAAVHCLQNEWRKSVICCRPEVRRTREHDFSPQTVCACVQCVHVCMCTDSVCMRVHVYSVCTCACVQTVCACVCMCTVCARVHVYSVCMRVHVYSVCTCACVQCVHVCMCTDSVCMCTVCACVHVCMCTACADSHWLPAVPQTETHCMHSSHPSPQTSAWNTQTQHIPTAHSNSIPHAAYHTLHSTCRAVYLQLVRNQILHTVWAPSVQHEMTRVHMHHVICTS